ncbi:MAG: DUF4197 domain-containing protein [Gammaproteobacteria bacterium]|nr:DUF4197 domain-containing protein [Gammaproteobacteria bacterium]
MSGRLGVVVVVAIFIVPGTIDAGWQDLIESVTGVAESGRDRSLDSLSEPEMVAGLKEALSVGSQRAIKLLGTKGGFLNDHSVRIPLPNALQQVEKGLRVIGQGAVADEFIATMNHAAERAVPATASIFGNTIKKMTLKDAQGIIRGADDAATRYFRNQSGEQLTQAILPIVKQATEKVGVTSAYKNMVNKAGFLGGLVDGQNLDLDSYITEKTLDGLFLKLANEEKLIRQNPMARSTELLQKVFATADR